VRGVPSVYVLGDAAHARHPETGEIYPPTAQMFFQHTQGFLVLHDLGNLCGIASDELLFTAP
jgi:NADH dehydrogenase FAD-containing subunit